MNIRILFSTIILLFLLKPISAQTYRFLQVNGNIKNEQNLALKKGDVIDAQEKIKIAPNAKAIVMSSQGGRFIIPKVGMDYQSEISYLFNEVVTPVRESSPISTRGTGLLVKDLGTYFGNKKFSILNDTLTFRLDPAIYPMVAQTSFVVFTYEYSGQKVAKVLSFEGDLLKINKNEIFVTKDGTSVNPDEVDKVSVYYFKDSQNNDREKITEFKPTFTSVDDLMEELGWVSETESYLAETDDQGKYYQLYSYVYEVYGAISDEDVLKNLLAKEGFIQDTSVEFDVDRYQND